MQNDGKLVLTNVLLETIWTMGFPEPDDAWTWSKTGTVTNPAYSLPLIVDEPINGGTIRYLPPNASTVTVVPKAGSIMWPLGSVVQCLLQNGSLGTAFLSIPTSAETVRD